jgi:hypothetical protein
MRVAFKAVLMLPIIGITEVVRGDLSLWTKTLCSLKARPFLVAGALPVGGLLAAAGAGFVAGLLTFFLGLLTTFTHIGAGWVIVDLGGGGGGGGADSKVDYGISLHGGAGMAEDSRHPGDDSLPGTDIMSLSRASRVWWKSALVRSPSCASSLNAETYPAKWVISETTSLFASTSVTR